jgi:hypothetical protein
MPPCNQVCGRAGAISDSEGAEDPGGGTEDLVVEEIGISILSGGSMSSPLLMRVATGSMCVDAALSGECLVSPQTPEPRAGNRGGAGLGVKSLQVDLDSALTCINPSSLSCLYLLLLISDRLSFAENH